MEINGRRQLSGYQYSLKYLILCSTVERNSYRVGTTWEWENYGRNFIKGWNLPL